jgi:RNA polymerase sigma-70 factor (ECF subfamily)
MTDIAVGRAHWDDLVRQIAIGARNHDDAEDLPHTAYLGLLRYRAQPPVDNVAAFPVRTAINANIDNRRHSRALKNVAITQQLEDSAGHLGISTSAVEKHMAKALLFLTQWTEGW